MPPLATPSATDATLTTTLACPAAVSPGPVSLLVGPGGSTPLHARRAALVAAATLRQRLRDEGVDVQLLAVHAPDLLDADVQPDHRLPHDRDADGPAVASRAQAWLGALCPSGTVHAVGWRAAAVAVAARRVTAVPVVAHVDRPPSWPDDPRPSPSARFGWAALAACDAVVVESALVRELAAAHGVPRARLTVAHPGLEADPGVQPWRPSPSRRPSVLSLGALDDLDALRALARPVREVDGELVVGCLTGLDPRTAAALRAHVGRDPVVGSLGGRVRVLTEPAGPACAAADLVADVSVRPGRGQGLLAAMAAGRAVVASDVGGAGDVVVDRVTGLLVAPGATPDVTRAVSGLLRDPFRLEAMGVAGLDRLQAAFAPSRFVSAVADVHRCLRGGGTQVGAQRRAR